MNIEVNAKSLSEVVAKYYEFLSPSDKRTLYQICTRGVRKALAQTAKQNTTQ